MLGPVKGFTDPKSLMRLRMKGARARAAPSLAHAARHAARIFFEAVAPQPDASVALYYPIGDELDAKPLGDELVARGHPIGLPVVLRRNAPLIFRRLTPDAPLVTASFGARHPGPEAPEFDPDIVVVPLLAFDRRGFRLGYGGGYYDRTLEALRKRAPVLAVGFAFGMQEVDAVPHTPLDQTLDVIVTERGAIRPR